MVVMSQAMTNGLSTLRHGLAEPRAEDPYPGGFYGAQGRAAGEIHGRIARQLLLALRRHRSLSWRVAQALARNCRREDYRRRRRRFRKGQRAASFAAPGIRRAAGA